MSRTYGPRVDPEGYQFPRTDAISYRREPPLLRDEFDTPRAGLVRLEIIPLAGGKPGTFSIEASYTIVKTIAWEEAGRRIEQTAPTSVTDAILLRGKGEHAARAIFRELAELFRQGTIPPWPEDHSWAA